MKKYYAEVSIDYFDNTIDEENPEGQEPFETCSGLSVVFDAKNDISGIKKAIKYAIDNLIDEGYDPKVHFINRLVIDTFYETTGEATKD